jgi:ADP-heptose:LPS heptosyltransferase
MRIADLAPLGDLDGVTLVSLQVGPGREQIADYFGRAPLINLGAALGDFADTLAVIEALDLVVCVDTSVGHLAGAAGKPVWIMLPHANDWRWLRDRTDTPWYPTARLFRQSAPRTWAPVVTAVAAAVCKQVAAR